MKSKLYSILFLLFILILQGCKTASRLYEKGNYDEAVTFAVKELQKNPGDPKKIALLQNAYSFAVEDHEKKIGNYLAGTHELKWEWIYYQYVDLQNLYNAIRKAPSVYEIIRPTDYSSWIASYGEKAGEARLERGLRWLQLGDKASAQKAYREFQAARRFRPGDFEIENMLDESFNKAVTRVVVKAADPFGFMFSNYRYEMQQFSDDLVQQLKYGNPHEFVKFYSVWDARSRDIEPDHIIEMQFTDMNPGRFHDRKSTREVTKEVVIREIVYRPDSIVKIYGPVKARITTTSRTLFSEAYLGVRILDRHGARLWNDYIGSRYSWAAEFTTYTGDERALSEEDKKLINRMPPSAPHESEIFRILKSNIYNDLLYRLKNFYSRY